MISLESKYPLGQKFNAFYGLYCRDYNIVLRNDEQIYGLGEWEQQRS